MRAAQFCARDAPDAPDAGICTLVEYIYLFRLSKYECSVFIPLFLNKSIYIYLGRIARPASPASGASHASQDFLAKIQGRTEQT